MLETNLRGRALQMHLYPSVRFPAAKGTFQPRVLGRVDLSQSKKQEAGCQPGDAKVFHSIPDSLSIVGIMNRIILLPMLLSLGFAQEAEKPVAIVTGAPL